MRIGDIYFDDTTQQLFIYTGMGWEKLEEDIEQEDLILDIENTKGV